GAETGRGNGGRQQCRSGAASGWGGTAGSTSRSRGGRGRNRSAARRCPAAAPRRRRARRSTPDPVGPARRRRNNLRAGLPSAQWRDCRGRGSGRQCATTKGNPLIKLIKKDALGSVRILRQVESSAGNGLYVRRDIADSKRFLRPLARRLARREAAALAAADGITGVPHLIAFDGRAVLRRYIEGRPMYAAKPTSP